MTLIFVLEKSQVNYIKKFFKYIPALLLCYFIPSIFNSMGVISGEESNLYFIASRYLLPASLVLLTLSIDLKKIINLGPKAIIMFLTGTLGILIGGPLSLLIVLHFFPNLIPISSDDLWRGLTTVAGSCRIGIYSNTGSSQDNEQVFLVVFGG